MMAGPLKMNAKADRAKMTRNAGSGVMSCRFAADFGPMADFARRNFLQTRWAS